VKAWIGDSFLFAWALVYWNARKTWWRLRKQRGVCPCQNPSDSGRAGETGCEAIVYWHNPARFKKVCPLLMRAPDGRWVCSVQTKEVRPFWGRAWGYAGAATGIGAVVTFVTVFSIMRLIGYEVSPRQLIWPPAWSELSGVRAQLFRKQARAYHDAGQLRMAVQALEVAYRFAPSDYATGRLLAHFYETTSIATADGLYARLMREHPAHSTETARVWMRSLLARGRLEALAGLAHEQLAADREYTVVWLNALIFAAAHSHHPDWLEEASRNEAVPEPARRLLALAAQVERAAPGQVAGLLQPTAADAQFAYGLIYRIDQLNRRGFPEQALTLIAQYRGVIGGRDEAGLLLAGIAQTGDEARLAKEFGYILAPGRPLSAAEFSLMGLQLIRYPNQPLLNEVTAAMPRIKGEAKQPQVEALLTLFCAAGVQQDKAAMKVIKNRLNELMPKSLSFIEPLQRFFLSRRGSRRVESILPRLDAMPLDFIYAMLGSYTYDE
jgi:hypothetical protein